MVTIPNSLNGLDLDLLRRAAAIYLGVAYPSGDVPEVVRRRLDWPDSADAATLLAGPPFERFDPPGSGSPPIRALRLGNASYPHMKLQVQPWSGPTGVLLSVNTHDQVLGLDPGAPDVEAFRALQAENQRIKERIERAWDDAGMPTFLRYLLDYVEAHAVR